MPSQSPLLLNPFAVQRPSGADGYGELMPLWNPGNLRFRYYRPRSFKRRALVVVLHGCGQEGASYARDSGWRELAGRLGFALLLPEQRRINNAEGCFNWFSPLHNRRHVGEAASIANAIHEMVRTFALDEGRIFVTGLSAGGAMASVMLSTYPELFAAGAIIAGVPYGCAHNFTDAQDCLTGVARVPATDLADFVLKASDHEGPWPRISVWHGSSDERVLPVNGDEIVRQWLTVHRLRARPHIVEKIDGYPHRVWLDREGQPVIEQYQIKGMGHGTPIAPAHGGRVAPNVLDASISSTDHIAAFFGLNDGVAKASDRTAA